MIDDDAHREAETIAGWLTAARQRQGAHTGPMPPRVIAETARTMAASMGFTAEEADARSIAMAFWQIFFTSTLVSDPANFIEARARLPRSLALVRDGVARYAAQPQLVFAAFHMTAFPMLAALLVPAVHDVHGRRGCVLVARRNMAWLRTPAGRWVEEVADVISTDGAGLRRLHAGLRDGSIQRLLILVDGPHRPGPGTHPLTGISPALGFKTGLLRKLLGLRIPVLPITHFWTENGIQLEWQPLLPEDAEMGVTAAARMIEALVRAHPEQWLNWAAARAAATQGKTTR